MSTRHRPALARTQGIALVVVLWIVVVLAILGGTFLSAMRAEMRMAHNLGIARNLVLTGELARACEQRGIRLMAHHHDWWFDNRWQRWPEMRCSGFRSLAQVAACEALKHPDHVDARREHATRERRRIAHAEIGETSFAAPTVAWSQVPTRPRRRSSRRMSCC